MEADIVQLLMQVGLSTLLLIIYSCSDQVLSIRERWLAKKRDAAATSVKSSAEARRRWQDAKGALTKHASSLKSHLSFSFGYSHSFRIQKPQRP